MVIVSRRSALVVRVRGTSGQPYSNPNQFNQNDQPRNLANQNPFRSMATVALLVNGRT